MAFNIEKHSSDYHCEALLELSVISLWKSVRIQTNINFSVSVVCIDCTVIGGKKEYSAECLGGRHPNTAKY